MRIFTSLMVFLYLSITVCQAQDPAQNGEWSDPVPFGIVPVAVANLPNGKLIMWSSQFRETFIGEGDGATFTEIYDPFFGQNGRGEGEFVTNLNHDMFCPGINNLADGRILSAGGTTSSKTSIYDHTTNTWSVASEMNIPRGYQGNVTLTDGSVFTLGGSWSGGSGGKKNGELWSKETGWINLPNVLGNNLFTAGDLASEDEGVYRADNHAWLWAGSNGKVFHAGPGSVMHWIDPTGLGSMVEVGKRGIPGFYDGFSMKGTTVMIDKDKILKVGGARSYDHLHPATEFSFVIDISDENNVVTTPVAGGGLNFGRTMHNSTVLPNGEVLITGGLDRAQLFTDVGARLTAEMYNPDTNRFRNVAGMSVARTYHSVAILLLDGRVFVGGGGLCDGTPDCVNHFDAEIYSPPYLFAPDGSPAQRPTITAPDVADYNTSINVTGSTDVTEFSLIRFSAATHSTNNEQRRIPVTFSGGGGSYSVNIPSRNYLPPGYYMLFGLNANGVPSVAETIQIGSDLPLTSNPNLVLDLEFDDASGNLAMDASGFANNGSVFDVDNFGQTKTANTTNWGTGLFGGALESDGAEYQSNSIVEIDYSVSLETVKDKLTIMAWVNRDEIVNNASILGHDSEAMFFGFHNSLFKWEFETESGAVASSYAGYSPASKWVHMAATYDGEHARLYANGVEIANQAIEGDIDFNPSEPNFSSFTVSGLYQRDANPGPNYNGSGVTDELDGRIDELKVFNVVLGPEEIKTYFSQGQTTGNPDVPNCDSPLIAEYKIGAAGEWIEGANINALEGQQVYIRAKGASGEYFITTTQDNGPTFSSVNDLPSQNVDGAYQIDTFISNGDGLTDVDDQGLFVLTTATGCATSIQLNIVAGCPPGSTDFETEFNINSVWCDNPASLYPCGAPSITLEEGQQLLLSVRPNDLGFPVAITLPDGTVVFESGFFGYFELGPVRVKDAGFYIFSTPDGCEKSLEVIVNETDCSVVQTEYNINSTEYITGASDITVEEGSQLILSIIPNTNAFTITGPNGNNKTSSFLDLIIPEASIDDSGTYLFTTGAGCEVTLNVSVEPVNCTIIETEYNVNNTAFITGENEVIVAEGSELLLSIIPNNTAYSITGPNGNNKPLDFFDLTLPDISIADEGIYTLTTSAGCIRTFNVTIGDPPPNPCTGTITPEYRLDGEWLFGENELNVDVGTDVILSMLPNGVGLTIQLPDGTTVGDNHALGNVTETDSGLYTLTSAEGCVTVIDLTVGEGNPINAVATANVVNGNAPMPISFTGSNSSADSGIAFYSWEFGDGGTSIEADPNHTYTQAGNYVARLTVTDNLGGTNTAILNITVNGQVGCTAVPSPWVSTDIGPVAIPGDACFDGTVFEIEASGADVWAGNDEFHYVYQELVGDGEIITQVLSQEYTSVWAKAGVMMRNSLSAQSQHAFMFLAPNPLGAGISSVFQSRSAPGLNPDPVANEYGPQLVGQYPHFVRLVREGNTFSGYSSDTNGNWQLLGSFDITMDNIIYVGLAVTSHNGGALNKSTFDNVVINGDVSSNEPPVAIATADVLTGIAPLPISFTGSGSTAESGIAFYNWTFGDGGTSIQSNPNYVYNNPGNYAAQLRVTDNLGGTNTTTLNVVVEPDPTQCNGTIIPEYRLDGEWLYGENDLTIDIGTELMFSMLPNGIGVTVEFPDGTIVGDDFLIGNVTEADSGAYILTSTEGCTTVINLTVGEGNTNTNQINAVASADVISGTIPLTVNFIGENSTADSGIVSYGWIFGDGNLASVANPEHIYTQAGNYVAQLTITDNLGYTDTATVNITVNNPTGDCVAVPNPWNNSDIGLVGAAGSACYDGNTFYIEGSGADIWNLEDEFHFVYQPLTGDGELIARILSQELTSDWAKAGIIMRNGMDAGAEFAFMTMLANPANLGPSYAFQYRDQRGEYLDGSNNVGLTPVGVYPYYLRLVRIGNTFSGYASETNGNWQFVGSIDIPMDETIFLGMAVSANNDGFLNEASFDNVTVTNGGTTNTLPNAIATSNVISGIAPLDVSFVGSGSTADAGIASFNWVFGDGGNSDVDDLTYTYNQAGNFTAQLTITDNNGAVDTATIVITVNDPVVNGPPNAIATSNVQSGAAPLTVSFTGSNSTADAGIASYLWNFGNGDSSSAPNPGYTYTSEGVYNAQLTITDNDNETATASITITVNTEVITEEPIVDAGVDQNIALPANSTSITGIAYDPDGGTIESYLWTQISGPNTANLLNENTTEVTVGNLTQGTYNFRLSVTDDDLETAFDEVLIIVEGNCNSQVQVLEDFESGTANGWVNSGNGTSGDYVVADPNRQYAGTINSQPEDDHTANGIYALISATNVSAGTDDIDNGTARVTSPIYNIANTSQLSIWYFFGQRDAGDDPDDFFLLEYSVDGGTNFNTMVLIGDVVSDAAWQEATATLPAGANLVIRLTASDATIDGDIIEAGLDDITITADCSQSQSFVANIDNFDSASDEIDEILSYRLFPNPSRGNSFLSIDSKSTELKAIQVFDISGRLIEKNMTKITKINSQLFDIDFSRLQNGVYNIRVITTKQELVTKRIIINN